MVNHGKIGVTANKASKATDQLMSLSDNDAKLFSYHAKVLQIKDMAA